MSTTVDNLETGSPIAGRHALSRPLVALLIVVLLAVVAPVAAGYRYHALPLALWSIGSGRIAAGTVRRGGQSEIVYSGKVIDCGFFSLVKQTPVNWQKLESEKR